MMKMMRKRTSINPQTKKRTRKWKVQTILESLIEGKTPHQKCDKCSIPKEECETIAAVAEVTEEEEDKVSTIFVFLDLSTKEKELCEEKRNQIRSKLILHPENKSGMKSSHVTICLAITNYYKQSKYNPIPFHNPTVFKKEGQVITLNLEPTGEDKHFLTGLHQHLLTTIGNQIQQDQHHTYNPHITMFTSRPNLPLPDLLPEELQLCNTDSLLKVDGKSQYIKSQQVKIMPSGLTVRRLGSAEVISSLRYDHPTSAIVLEPLVDEASGKTEEALISILKKAKNSKTKIMRHLAKDLNKLCQYSLVSPVESANQLFSLAATCSTTEILQQELKNLLAPES